MNEIDLKEFEWKIVVRNLSIDDYERLDELQILCFPGMKPWSREQLESPLKRFPDGQIGIEVDGKLVASSSLILNYEDQTDWHDYKRLSDGGYIRNHAPSGDTLYGI